MSPKDKEFGIDLSDEVVRGSTVSQKGEILPPAPRPAPPPAPAKPPTPEVVETKALTPWQKTTREVAGVTAGMGSALALGKLTGPLFIKPTCARRVIESFKVLYSSEVRTDGSLNDISRIRFAFF